MIKMKQKNGRFLTSVFLWLLGLLAACGGESAGQPTPTPTPADILQRAVSRLTTTSGFHFTVNLSGAPAYLDPSGQVAFRTAVGDFTSPDRAQATVRAAAFGLITDINVISVGENQWQTNLLTKRWESLPPNWGFNPGSLFDAANGLPAILTEDMGNAILTCSERVSDGSNQAVYVITGQVAGERLAAISGGLIGPQPVDVNLWVVPESYEIIRILVTEPGEDGSEASVWQLDFSQYDQELAIEPPG
jgi:hypothetical protein